MYGKSSNEEKLVPREANVDIRCTLGKCEFENASSVVKEYKGGLVSKPNWRTNPKPKSRLQNYREEPSIQRRKFLFSHQRIKNRYKISPIAIQNIPKKIVQFKKNIEKPLDQRKKCKTHVANRAPPLPTATQVEVSGGKAGMGSDAKEGYIRPLILWLSPLYIRV